MPLLISAQSVRLKLAGPPCCEAVDMGGGMNEYRRSQVKKELQNILKIAE